MKGQWSYGWTSLGKSAAYDDFAQAKDSFWIVSGHVKFVTYFCVYSEVSWENILKKKCDELGKEDCGSILQMSKLKKIIYELKRGTKLDGRESNEAKIVTWLRSRDCDNIDDSQNLKDRAIQEQIRILLYHIR